MNAADETPMNADRCAVCGGDPTKVLEPGACHCNDLGLGMGPTEEEMQRAYEREKRRRIARRRYR